MSKPPEAPVLLTGASGALGRVLARHLGGTLGWQLRLTDIQPFPDPLPAGARFVRADLEDGPAILRLAEGCGAIVHFGGISVEQPFETVLGANIRGLYHVYEAARRERARVVFASSNHTVGFHRRDTPITADDPTRPDGYYGLSKVYGEGMGRLYWHKHGVSSVFLRIGSCLPEPVDARMLATWLSYPDLERLVERSVLADTQGCAVVWGASNNAAMDWWRDDAREAIGWTPQDSADGWTQALRDRPGPSPLADAHQGGGYCAIDRFDEP